MKIFIVALGLVAAGAIEQTVVAQPQRSAWNGVYSKDQARRGQALYAQECSPCHGPSGGR
jgi:mono/diheme cytochrome c family protein